MCVLILFCVGGIWNKCSAKRRETKGDLWEWQNWAFMFDDVCCWRDTNLIGTDCDSGRDKTVRPVNYPPRGLTLELVVCDQDPGTLRYSGDQHRSTLSKAQERLRRLKVDVSPVACRACQETSIVPA